MKHAHVPIDHSKINASEDVTEEQVERLYTFAARELEYHDALNDLAENEVDPHEIVNEAFARLAEARKKTPSLKPGSAIYKIVLDVLSEKVATLEERERREISVEQNVKDPALEDGFRTLGEHVLYFWQPDADLQMSDIIPDLEVPSPEEIEDMKTRQRVLYKALDALPKDWREAFILYAVEQINVKEISQIQNIGAESVKKNIADAQRFLLARMRDRLLLEGRKPDQPPHVHDRG